jgi:CO dehydrogenase/acetyl-CoA synthase gamma subunit (corrinoid Fe-S protein)
MGVEQQAKAPETRGVLVDPRFEKDLPDTQEQSLPTRRFAAIAAEQDATYPMLAPAASLHVGGEEEVYDEQILAGLVNV